MKLLLDTHAFLWFVNADAALSQPAKSLIEDANNEIFLSIASIWEIAIKVSLGKLSAPVPFEKFITEQMSINNCVLLPISVHHVGTIVTLPFHHRDPFDRLLVAQALTENMPIISQDTLLDAYGIHRRW